MAISINDFWRLLAECRLFSPADCQKLHARFSQMKGEANAGACAQWLVSQRALTKYQAKVLLSGRPGPFHYGPYQLRDRLTTGRLAGCFRAVHAPTRHPVLLWFLSGEVLQNPDAHNRAVRQLSDASQIVHACLSRTYQVVDLGAYKFVVIEDLSGAAADQALAAGAPFAPPDACRLIRQVALGAAALHAGEVIHGDIRPHNVWIDSQGQARLIQLPLSRDPHLPPGSPLDDALPPERRTLLADYAAPEFARSSQRPDTFTDIYAIGCTLYHFLAAHPPFPDGDIAAKLKRHASPTNLPAIPSGVSAELTTVVAKAMAKDRTLRYQSISQLVEDLTRFVDAGQRNLAPRRVASEANFRAWLNTQPPAPEVPVAQPKLLTESVMPAPAMAPNDTGSRDAPLVVVAAVPPVVSPQQHLAADRVATNGALDIPLVSAKSGATSAAALIRQRRRRSRNNAIFMLALIGAVGIGAGVGYVVYRRGQADTVAVNSQEQEGEADSQTHGDDSARSNDARSEGDDEAGDHSVNVVADDGKALWASPTSGEPLSWAHLPSRAEIVMALRPAELMRHAEGEKVLAALGPQGAAAVAAAEEAIGMPLAEVESLTIAWTNAAGKWTATYAVRPVSAISAQALAEKWQGFEARQEGANHFFVSAPVQRAYFAPPAEEGKLFVVSIAELMPEIVNSGPQSLPLIREMVKLLQTSDSRRACTVLFTKKAILVDGKAVFDAAGLARLHAALEWWLGDDSKAAALSLHLADNCYLEGRVVGSAQTTTPAELTAAMRQRMQRLAPEIEDFLSRIELHPHGRRILISLASMARFLQEHLRIDSEDEQVVLNCYLPSVAAHNLLFAAELAVAQPVMSQPPATAPAGTSVAAGSTADKLRKTISFMQSGDTLEKALQTVSSEIGVPIEILGNDFVPEGITRNNRFDVSAQNLPASEVIRQILLKANPDGKLVYVVGPKSPGGEEVIRITTRTAAKTRGDKLPPEFAAPANETKSKGGSGKKA